MDLRHKAELLNKPGIKTLIFGFYVESAGKFRYYLLWYDYDGRKNRDYDGLLQTFIRFI